VSHPHILSGGDTRSVLVDTLGSDFQYAVAPFKTEIVEMAACLNGDVHRAAMRLLMERNGRRPTGMEQQLIIAALAELQADGGGPGVRVRAVSRVPLPSRDGRQLSALQMH
jgi:hypothetical protein